MCSIGVEESVVRKVSDGWEKEEDENVDGRGGGGDLVGVRGANASLEISALRRLVSLGHRDRGGEEEQGLSLPSPPPPPPPSHNGRFSFHFGPQKGSVKERPLSLVWMYRVTIQN